MNLLSFWRTQIGAILLLVLMGGAAWAQVGAIETSQDAKALQITIRWPKAASTENFRVSIDDSPGFRQPLLARAVRGQSLTLDVLEAGLAPGTTYFVRVEPGGLTGRFRLQSAIGSVPLPDKNYVQQAWERVGRATLSLYSGVRWNAAARDWELDKQWPYAEFKSGTQAYYLEPPGRAAVNLSLVRRDVALMDELARFYLAYAERFVTLGELRKRESPRIAVNLLANQGPDTARTLSWVQETPGKTYQGECSLCNVQFLHPAARLIRLITTLTDAERTPAMKRFAAAYGPLIVRDQLLRYVYVAEWDYWGAREVPKQLLAAWNWIIEARARPKLSYQNSVRDTDLWLIAIAAEMLGAHANDPDLVPLGADDKRATQQIVDVGVRLFQKKRTLYSDTRSLAGQRVDSASYFNGDFDDHPELAYSGYEGKDFPTPAQKKVAQGVSWDIAHFYRVPVFLRSLYDNRKATGNAFPAARDFQLIANQLMYRVFTGDFSKPLFRNFFDGTDGWYRAAYGGSKTYGYPPSRHSDVKIMEPTLTATMPQGWGLIAFFQEDLSKLQDAWIRLALSSDPDVIAFKDRFYFYNKLPFAFTTADGKLQYPFLLFQVLAQLPSAP